MFDIVKAIQRNPVMASRVWGSPWAISQQGHQLIQGMVLSDEPVTLNDSNRIAKIGRVGVRVISGVLVTEPDEWWENIDSYPEIQRDLENLLNDDGIDSVVMYFHSCPGGSCRNGWALADWIRAQRGRKPIVSVIDDFAYSMGYALASQADMVVIGPEDGAGAIGIILEHMSLAGALKQDGVEVSLMTRGEHKTDGHWAIPLTDRARASLMRVVDMHYKEFKRVVQAGRPAFADSAIEAGVFEAETFMGSEAVKMGLADEIGTLEGTIAALSA